MTHVLSCTAEETSLLNDAQSFRKKATITKKIRGQMTAAHEALQAELRQRSLLVPADFDSRRSRFVKGEHPEGCPSQYLDCPNPHDS